MRAMLARPHKGSPSQLAYFIGTVSEVETEFGLVLVPSTSWFEGDAHIFADETSAEAMAEVLKAHSPTGAPWHPIPYLGAAA